MNLWAIPPPFDTSSDGQKSSSPSSGSSSTKLPQIRVLTSSMRKERLGQSNRDGLKVSYSGHTSMLANTPPLLFKNVEDGGERRRTQLKRGDRFPNKEGPWMPATKHAHQWSGCAPNGMRLFGPAPSALLSKDKKERRDKGLRQKLTKLHSELNDFESSNISSHHGSGGKSLMEMTAAHGRLSSDLRELQQVADLRCASRWEPGLGRRQGVRAAHGRRVFGIAFNGFIGV
mmetsp:Transcript_30347/g.61797  ORF Transcript_30347/g.61797 Transcript_30347/m.61797 type:complete len:230 (-) Transcript_30347:356-1045(-)